MQHPEPATIFEKSGEWSTLMQKPKTQYNIKYITTLSLVSALASNLSPVYIAEISPADLRERFVSVQQLTIAMGILLAQN